MADLIAQGAESQQRWRHELPEREAVTLGRNSGSWGTPWDASISRRHAELRWLGDRLEVRLLETAKNPIFVRGRETKSFDLKPGEHFVIGATTFTLAGEEVEIALHTPRPVEEKTFSAQYLQEIRFRDPDYRIEVLSRLPELISGAASDHEMFLRLVNMLLSGIHRADAAAVVAVKRAARGAADQAGDAAAAKVGVLYWDRRLATSGGFQPSESLIREAVQRRQSVLHVWESTTADQAQPFTMQENFDWAFCTPVLGEASKGWGIYVTGRSANQGQKTPSSTEPTDLRDDLKFAEMVAATLSSLRTVQNLQREKMSLGQFFSPRVLDALEGEDPEQALAPRETQVSVLFCDLRGFSLESEKWAHDLLGLLERVSKALGVLTHHILDQGGVVGDFQGDAAMGFWGWPVAQEDAVERACLAALAIRADFEDAARRPGHPLANFRMGIGVATGTAVAGKIGTLDQGKVTVFGPVVNLASRLEGMTKLLRVPILVDETTAEVVRRRLPATSARYRRLAKVRPYGLDTAVVVSEILPTAENYPALTDEHLASYEAAVDAFLSGEWPRAVELLHLVPAHDLAKDFLMLFIAQHNRTPPHGWDGVIPLSTK